MVWVLAHGSNSFLDRARGMLTHRRTILRILATSACITFIVCWNAPDVERLHGMNFLPHRLGDGNKLDVSRLPCRDIAGGNDTLMVLRTGSTELEDRFAVHLNTSLRCYPHYMVFSDLEEDYEGQHVIDALDSVDVNIREHHSDFALYRRLQLTGRAGLAAEELSGSPESFARASGNAENPGWKLDKWKFMPMVNRTFHEYPNMKWYVFIEADTYVLWSMLQQYLSLLDHTKPHYSGHQMFIGPDLFAHGGAGFIVSQPAMAMITQYYAAHKTDVEAFTDNHWAGDCVLGKYFKDAGVPFANSWPHFQGDYPGLVAYAGPDGRSALAKQHREWCFPTISYHHMSAEMIQGFWVFEQEWISVNNVTSQTLRHGDVFTQYVLPQMLEGEKAEWDNHSDGDGSKEDTIEDCRKQCETRPDCKQYSFTHVTRDCRTRVDPRLGKPGKGTQSGWIDDRLLAFVENAAPCGDEDWST